MKKIKITDTAFKVYNQEIFSWGASELHEVTQAIESLAEHPFPEGALRVKSLPDCYQITTTKWIIVYQVDEKYFMSLFMENILSPLFSELTNSSFENAAVLILHLLPNNN